MLRRFSPLQSFAFGLIITCAQIAIAVGFSNPEGSLADRYRTLVQHDSYWFANIIERGYGTIIPPSNHKVMEVSNVAFFPAYPLLAGAVKRLTNLSTYDALLITAQAAAWGFWTYFFLFCERWAVPMTLSVFGALAIAAHPAAFYLVAAYSESLFLMMVAGFIYWSTREGRSARALAVLHGFTMSATRIVGLPCAAFPVLHSIFSSGRPRSQSFRAEAVIPSEVEGSRDITLTVRPRHPSTLLGMTIARYRAPAIVMLLSMLGGLSFFAYCQFRWSRWDLYMLTQQSGWAIRPDYLAVFDPGNYRWQLPPLYDTTRASQFASTLAAAVFGLLAVAELIGALRRRNDWTSRLGLYFCAAVVYYLSLAGVASVQMESMLRYDLCVHALVVLALLHLLRQFQVTPVYVRALGMAVASLVFAAGLTLQGYYVWNFTQGNWVA